MQRNVLVIVLAITALGVLAIAPALAQVDGGAPLDTTLLDDACGCDTDCRDQGCGCGCAGIGGFAGACGYACPGIVGGVEAVFLKPHIKNNVAFFSTETRQGDDCTAATFFSYDYEISPRVWLGYVGPEGLGGRVRYWDFDHTSKTATGNSENCQYWTPTTLDYGYDGSSEAVARSGIDAHILDIEFTQTAMLGCWDILWGGGLRHGSVAQFYGAECVNSPYDDSLDVRSRFDGIGPTIFAETRRPFGNWGLALVGNVRGSLLYGDHSARIIDQQIYVEAQMDNDTYCYKNGDSSLAIGELQVGFEWAQEVNNCGILFAQVLWEGQIWTNTGTAMLPMTNDNLGLMGFAVTMGLTR